MSETNRWADLIGNSHLRSWFSSGISRGRIGGSFLFVGPPGVGKQTVADLLALTLMCKQSSPAEMSPCGTCEACVQVTARTHPDVIRVEKPADKSYLPLELLIGRPEQRMQEGFCRDIRLRPYNGKRKVAILQDADFLNEEGANCLLKTLEEPPANSLIILIGTSEQKQLPTIRSRCQIIRFAPLTTDESAQLVRQVHGVEATDDAIAAAVTAAAGNMHTVLRQLSGESNELREAVQNQLRAPHPDPVSLARVITKYVEDAGKEASKRRNAMRDVFAIAVQHFRHQMRSAVNETGVHPVTLARLDRSIRALHEVDRNANQATLIECYACDISTGTTGNRGNIG